MYSYSRVSIARRHFVSIAICVVAAADFLAINLLDGKVSPTNMVHQFCLRAIPIIALIACIIMEMARKFVHSRLYGMCPEYRGDVKSLNAGVNLSGDQLRKWLFNEEWIFNEESATTYSSEIHLTRGFHLRHVDYYPGSQSLNTFLFTLGLLTILSCLVLQVLRDKLGLGKQGFIPGTSSLNSIMIVLMPIVVLSAIVAAVGARVLTSEYYAHNYKFAKLAESKDKAIESGAITGKWGRWSVPITVKNGSSNPNPSSESNDQSSDEEETEFKLPSGVAQDDIITREDGSKYYVKDCGSVVEVLASGAAIYDIMGVRARPTFMNRRYLGHVFSVAAVAIQLLFIIVLTTLHGQVMNSDANRFACLSLCFFASIASLFLAARRFFEHQACGIELDAEAPKSLKNSKFLHHAETFAMGSLGLGLLSGAVSGMVAPAVFSKFMNMNVPNASMHLTAGQLTFVLILAVALITVLTPVALHLGKKTKTAIDSATARCRGRGGSVGINHMDATPPPGFMNDTRTQGCFSSISSCFSRGSREYEPV